MAQGKVPSQIYFVRLECHISMRMKFNVCSDVKILKQPNTPRNLNLLRRAKQENFFIRCYYVLTADAQINVARVASRVSAGGHDVPVEKIISRYDRALDLVKELVPICDVCHIYDNSLTAPYRIFKKRKDQFWYCPEPGIWLKKDIIALTGIKSAVRGALNK